MTRPELAAARSLLFTPASDPGKIGRALASEADIPVADLEDAIVPGAKDSARRSLCSFIETGEPRRPFWIRINAPDTAWGRADLAALLGRPGAIEGLVLPKASPVTLEALGETGLPVIAIVETARGLRTAYEIAAHPDVAALMLGAADLGAELGWRPRADGLELLYARSVLVVDSAAAGIRPPFDVVHVDLHDGESLQAEAEFARSVGMGGKACIHPGQLAVVNRAFTPSEEEMATARRVVSAYEESARDGEGVAVWDGRMIDLPVLTHAQAVLAQATAYTAHLNERKA
jgi:citrate lyase beta subunit